MNYSKDVSTRASMSRTFIILQVNLLSYFHKLMRIYFHDFSFILKPSNSIALDCELSFLNFNLSHRRVISKDQKHLLTCQQQNEC